MEVWSLLLLLLLLLSVAATLVRTAGGADAVRGRPPQLGSAGRGVMRRRAVSLRHVSRLAEVLAGRGDRLGFDVDVVVGANRETGAGRPADSRRSSYSCDCGVMAPSSGKVAGMLTENFLLMGPEPYLLV